MGGAAGFRDLGEELRDLCWWFRVQGSEYRIDECLSLLPGQRKPRQEFRS